MSVNDILIDSICGMVPVPDEPPDQSPMTESDTAVAEVIGKHSESTVVASVWGDMTVIFDSLSVRYTCCGVSVGSCTGCVMCPFHHLLYRFRIDPPPPY